MLLGGGWVGDMFPRGGWCLGYLLWWATLLEVSRVLAVVGGVTCYPP